MAEDDSKISEIQEKITSLEKLRSELGDEIVDEKIAALRAKIQALRTGGSLVQGSVESQGDFVGRDQTVQAGDQGFAIKGDISDSTVIHAQTVVLAERLWRGVEPSLPKVNLQQATRAYLNYLIDRHYYLNLKGMGVSDRIPLRLRLLDLYVPLKARLELPEGETWMRDLRLAGRPVSQAEYQQTLRLSNPVPVLEILRQNSGLIVLGDPGAGKTTFLKYLALSLASGNGHETGLGDRLPILLPLAAYANALQKSDVRLDDFIAKYFADIGADLPIDTMLAEALQAGRALILLDGLDEVKDPNLRNTVVERVVDFYAFHRRRGNKFVITSRIIGYRAVRPAAEGLVECTLVDFDDDEISLFVDRWMTALEKQAQGDTQVARADAENDRKELMDAIYENPGIRRLAATPLLLTILALVKRQGVTLPERRVQLYDQYVSTLLSTWNRARSLSGRAPGRDLDEVQTVRILAPLALWMHQVNPGVGLVKREDLRRKLEELFAERGDANPQAAAIQFLQDVREYSALLLERGPGEYGFIHLTFEEYLSAVAIALQAQGNARLIAHFLASHIGEPAWQEISLLTIAYIGIRQQLPKVAGEVITTLLKESPGPPGQAAVLAGEAVLDTWPSGVLPESKGEVIKALIPAMQNSAVSTDLRRHAGLLLGRLGWRPQDLGRFVEVPAGKFFFGPRKEEKEIPYPYWIAKYPVTNIQFARFVLAGGYHQQEWWSKNGWDWRTGAYDERSLEAIERDWLEHRPVERRSEPYFWHNPDLSNPIFPVVGVNWFEAEAYCRWLSTQIVAKPAEYTVRLATSLEWERASRGVEGFEYPWGMSFRKENANTWETITNQSSSSKGTTAVCTYPQGISPVGAWDMSGNVWEWTTTWYDEDKRYRVVRGGSWIGYQWFARTSFCNWSIPLMFNDDLGFRIVIAPQDGIQD
ncbi:MAG: NACHT domain-containing protein [Candidatus Villigracilaceae bacterium]